MILRPDRGCGTVILDREEYVNKIYAIINDTSKFKKLSSDPTILREGQLQQFLRTLKNFERTLKVFLPMKFMGKHILVVLNQHLFMVYLKFIS